MNYTLRLLAPALLAVIAAASARADVITQTLGITITPSIYGDFSTGGFLQFDPKLGTLNAVTASLTGSVTFSPTAPGGSYAVNFDYYAGSGSGISYTNTQSATISISQAVDPLAVTAQGGFVNYNLGFIGYSANNGFIGPGSVVGKLVYDYTPAASTPEPSSLLLAGTGLLTLATAMRRRK